MKQNEVFFLFTVFAAIDGEGNTKFGFLFLVIDMQITWKSIVGTVQLLIAKVVAVINRKWKLS